MLLKVDQRHWRWQNSISHISLSIGFYTARSCKSYPTAVQLHQSKACMPYAIPD